MIGALMLVVTLALVTYLLSQIILGRRSSRWPQVPGKLVSFTIEQRTLSSKFPSMIDSSVLHIVKVKYEYEVRGSKYRSSRIGFGKDLSYKSLEEIERDELLGTIKKDDFVVYYCDPFPGLSVLRKGLHNEKEHVLVILFVLSVVAFLFILRFIVAKLI